MQVKLAAEMLNLKPFCMYPLTVQVLSVKFADLWRGMPRKNIKKACNARFAYFCMSPWRHIAIC